MQYTPGLRENLCTPVITMWNMEDQEVLPLVAGPMKGIGVREAVTISREDGIMTEWITVEVDR